MTQDIPLLETIINTTKTAINGFAQNGEHHLSLGRSYSEWAPDRDGATLVWRDLSVYAHHRQQKNFKKIVNNVNGAVKPGNLVALMGSSGAGKSTLMSALAYRNPAGFRSDGDILVNGRTLGNYMHRLSGYMHQDDLFLGCLTVEEHLFFMSQLKMDRRNSRKDKNKLVEQLLQEVGLQHVRHSRIGQEGDEKLISGGEKKRLAFATELLTNPIILFCDEPTTGLDSFTAQKLVRMMKKLAVDGRTIVCTIHQPSSELFSMFDQLLLVADGRIAFSGTPQNALNFFESNGYTCPKDYNPADFFISTLASTPGSEDAARATIKRICDVFSVSDAAKELECIIQLEIHMMKTSKDAYIKRKSDFKEAFWWTKLYWLTYRSLLQVLRDKSVQTFRTVQKIAIGIMAGLCFVGTDFLTQYGIQSVQGALFILISENTFTPMYSTIAIFPQEFPLLVREYRSGLYSTGTYYVAKMFSLFPGLILEPALFGVVLYWLAGLRATPYAFFMTMIISAMVMNVSTACGCMFSCAFESISLAMAYLIPFDYTLMITSGLFIKLSSLPVYASWLQYLSWLMYSNEAMTIIQWQDITNITCINEEPNLPCLRDGRQVIENYSFSESHFYRNIIAMVVLYFVFHLLAFTFLNRRTKKK